MAAGLGTFKFFRCTISIAIARAVQRTSCTETASSSSLVECIHSIIAVTRVTQRNKPIALKDYSKVDSI